MQRESYQITAQMSTNERNVNLDPREQTREYGSASPSQAGWQPRKRAPWRIVLFCVCALAVAVGITELTGGIPISALHKALPTHAFSLNGQGSLVVNEDSSLLRVHAGNTSQIIVRPTEYAYGLGSDLSDLRVQYAQQGNTLTVTTSQDWGIIELGIRGIDLDITVPANVNLTVHGSSGDVSLTGIDGEINANIDSGSLSLNNINGSLALSTASGDITIANEHGPVRAQTDSGDIRIDHAAGAMSLSSDSGSIILNEAQISGQDHFQTDSGDIQFSGALDPRGTYRMETASGSITLDLPASSSFQLTTSTDSGSVHNAFSAAVVGSAPQAVIALSTDSGDINLQKQ